MFRAAAVVPILGTMFLVGCAGKSPISAQEVESAFHHHGLHTVILFDKTHPTPGVIVGGFGGSGGFKRAVAEVGEPGSGPWDIDGTVFKNGHDAATWCRSIPAELRWCQQVRNVGVMYDSKTRTRAKAAIAELRASS